MRILIVRHAVAESRDPRRWPDDGKRPLRPEGIRRFRRSARTLARLFGPADQVWSSPLLRAWETAKLLREEAGWPAPQATPWLEPQQDPEHARRFVGELESVRRIVLVGHEPHLSALLSLFLAGRPDAITADFKKGGAACLRWRAADPPEPATLLGFYSPRGLAGGRPPRR